MVHLGKEYRVQCTILVTFLKAGSSFKIKSLREVLRSWPNLTRGSSATPRPLEPLQRGTGVRAGSRKRLSGGGGRSLLFVCGQ